MWSGVWWYFRFLGEWPFRFLRASCFHEHASLTARRRRAPVIFWALLALLGNVEYFWGRRRGKILCFLHLYGFLGDDLLRY